MRMLRRILVVVASGALMLTAACTGEDDSSQAGQAPSSAAASAPSDPKGKAEVERKYQVSEQTSGECSTSEDDGLITAADVNEVVGNGTSYRVDTCLVIGYIQRNFVTGDGKTHPSINFGSVKGQGAIVAFNRLKQNSPHEVEVSIVAKDGTPIEQFRAPGFSQVICTNCTDPSRAVLVALYCTDFRTDAESIKLDDSYLLKLGKRAQDRMLAHY